MDTQSPKTDSKPKTKTGFKLTLFIVFIIFIALLIFINQSRKKSRSQPEPISLTPAAQIIKTAGSIRLSTISLDKVVDVDKAMDVEVIASSDEKSIVGYDVILAYEEGVVEVVSATSLLPDFDLYEFKYSDHFIITGAKKLDAIEPSVFDSTAIARIKLIPKRTGQLNLKVLSTLGKEKTQLVDEETQVLRPAVSEITLEIE